MSRSRQDAPGTYTYQRPSDNNPSQMLLRGDQAIGSGNQQVNGRMFTTRKSGPTGHGNLPAFQQGTVVLDTDLYGVTHMANISPNKINTARFTFNGYYTNANYRPQVELGDLKKLGFAEQLLHVHARLPAVKCDRVLSGKYSADQDLARLQYPRLERRFFLDSRPNSIQLGTDGIRRTSRTLISRTNGSFTFNGNFSNAALTDFMLGRPSAFRQGSPAPDNVRGLHLSWYVQDDIKVNRRLTLNLGLRYELPLPPIAINNAAMLYRAGAQSTVYVNAPPGVLFYGDPDVRARGATQRNRFSPPDLASRIRCHRVRKPCFGADMASFTIRRGRTSKGSLRSTSPSHDHRHQRAAEHRQSMVDFSRREPAPVHAGQGCDFRSADYRTVLWPELPRVDDAAVEREYSA